jgi:hypothetical protein
MLDVLFNKADDMGLSDAKKRVTVQNMIDFKYDMKFDDIFIPARSFMHLTSQDDQIKCLKNIYSPWITEEDFWSTGVMIVKIGLRKPSLKRSIKARTTGRLKRKVKRAVNPFYGKKGVGWVRNPKRAAYNKVYRKTTFGIGDLFKGLFR